MFTLILTQNRQYATFIQKGLLYENLSSEVLLAEDLSEKNALLLAADGVILHFESKVLIESCIKTCLSVKPTMPFLVASSHYQEFFDELKNNGKIAYYCTSPFPFRLMATEMKFAIYQSKEKIPIPRYVLRDLELDIESHNVRIRDKYIYLRSKEFSLLQFFMENPGKLLSRISILEHVWDHNSDILTNTVDVHISQLRKKIEKNTGQKYIHTVPCMGYILE
jgi:DNA-binding response OmpR family regulator